ncbi:MAG: hypothetical protein ACFFFH_18405, partial [Candidatus Thorarchaeota archaeon]
KEIFSQFLSRRLPIIIGLFVLGLAVIFISLFLFFQIGVSSYNSEIMGFLNLPQIYSSQLISIIMVNNALLSYIIFGSAFLGFMGLLNLLFSFQRRKRNLNSSFNNSRHYIQLFIIILIFYLMGTLIHLLISTATMDEVGRWSYLQNAVLGRYLAPVFPLFLIIIGFYYDEIRLEETQVNQKKKVLFPPRKAFILSTIISTFFLLFIPVPIYRVSDNLEFSLINGFLYFFPIFQDPLKIIIILTPILIAIFMKKNFSFLNVSYREIIIVFILFFILLNSIASYAIFKHRSDEENTFHQIGRWFALNSIENHTIWMDKRDYVPSWRRDSDRIYVLVHVALGIEFWSNNKINPYNSTAELSIGTHYFISLYSDFANSTLPVDLAPIIKINITKSILDGVRSNLINEENLTVYLFQYNKTESNYLLDKLL